MISRRNAVKLASVGIVTPSVMTGCGSSEGLDYPDEFITLADPNDVPMYRIHAAHTGSLLRGSAIPIGKFSESWVQYGSTSTNPPLISSNVIYKFDSEAIQGFATNTGEHVLNIPFHMPFGSNKYT